MKKISSLFVLSTLISSPLYAQPAKPITLGTGSETGLYYVTGNAICQLVNRTDNLPDCKALASEASVDNLNAIANGQIELGIVQSDWQYNAYNGVGSFADKKNDKLRAVFSIYPEPFTIIARDDTNIKTFEDLKGKRFNIGLDGSGTQATANVLLNAKGWTAADFKVLDKLPPAEMVKALCNNGLDAASYNVGHPNTALKEATESCDLHLVPITGEVVDKLIQAHSYYAKATIPAKTYNGTDQAVDSFGVYATLVTSADVSEERVYDVVKSVFDNFERFKKSHPAFANLKESEMIKNALSAPLHEGAIKYYKERGWL
ncbi:TAXI family TRAP transporter solute-binding subunit [Actinobacillus minor]|uniref:TAXI family TRAP transporter solute-binding subunit n=1 Tax=Actinobacillus minor TaxID=51047 RepID=UPI0026EE6256|nr:TAXI family TRAP transporter solute-binding subunit [Actinobacillus minor]